MSRNLSKKILSIAFLFILSFTIIPVPVSATDLAKTLGDLKKEYQDLLNEKAQNDKQSAAAKAEIAAKEKAVKDAEAAKTKAEADQHATEQAIEASNEKINQLKGEANEVLLYLQQMQGQNAYIEYVTGATSMTDLVTRIAAIEQISEHIQTTMNNLQVEIKKNEQLKKELEQKQKDLASQIVIYQNTIKKQYSNLESYDKYALGIEEKIKVKKEDLDAYIKSCALNAPQKGDSAKLVGDCTNMPYNGQWLKPLYKGVITSEVDMRWGAFHNALDIGGNSEGTPVYAAAAGRVSGKISQYYCGGNMLYIDVTVGGQQYTTYYYHLYRFNVNVGDIVDQNTIIGWVGGGSTSTANGGYDTCTFGAHLHYGVAKGWYNPRVGIPRANVITPPGFPNQYLWRFYSRTDWYGN